MSKENTMENMENVDLETMVDELEEGEEIVDAKVRSPRRAKVKKWLTKIGVPVGTFILGVVAMALVGGAFGGNESDPSEGPSVDPVGGTTDNNY